MPTAIHILLIHLLVFEYDDTSVTMRSNVFDSFAKRLIFLVLDGGPSSEEAAAHASPSFVAAALLLAAVRVVVSMLDWLV